MHDLLAHRGPDGSGSYQDQHVTLMSRRLAIVDPVGGAQPLYSEDRSVVLVANGEIYNDAELRTQLGRQGHQFSTGSDCETIVHLYEELGSACVGRLRGMFAFALWDARRRRLLLARDRMGEKPLYLHVAPDRLLFASELRSILGSGQVPFRLDPDAVNLFFHHQYVPEPLTPVPGVIKLPPAHTLAVEVDSWSMRLARYWALADAEPRHGDPVAVLRRELTDVACRVGRSDVPVGVALSGGMDSGLVAALLATERDRQVQAFTVGYTGRPDTDERAEARQLAAWLGIGYHEVELSSGDAVEAFPRVVRSADDPIADMSAFGYDAIARLARAHGVPVLLSGQGSDELFWGYGWVREALRRSLRRACRWRRQARPVAVSARLRAAAASRSQPAVGAGQLSFYECNSDFRQATREVARIYPRRFARTLNPSRTFPATAPPPWHRPDLDITRLACESYLLENGLTQGDRLSMAHSVEVRAPLVDHRFVEAVIGLRKANPDHHMPPKHRLREAARGLLPDAVVDRPKRPFQTPLATWHAALFAAYGRCLEDGFLVGHGVLAPTAARRLAAGPRPDACGSPLSFKALVLEAWCRAAVGDGELSVVPAAPAPVRACGLSPPASRSAQPLSSSGEALCG